MQLISQIQSVFEAHRNAEIAMQQSAYLKNLFPFLGLKKPLQAQLLKPLLKHAEITSETVQQLWDLPEREYHYAACTLAEKLSDLVLFEKMLRSNSWWDTVDWIAANMISNYFKQQPKKLGLMDQWIQDDCMWIRRTALIFQLKWKYQTDWSRLQNYVLQTCHEKEFFIRKAIGWALRQYSKTHADRVSQFIDQHGDKLSPLSFREASKYL